MLRCPPRPTRERSDFASPLIGRTAQTLAVGGRDVAASSNRFVIAHNAVARSNDEYRCWSIQIWLHEFRRELRELGGHLAPIATHSRRRFPRFGSKASRHHCAVAGRTTFNRQEIERKLIDW
jgi:hypothetical protein